MMRFTPPPSSGLAHFENMSWICSSVVKKLRLPICMIRGQGCEVHGTSGYEGETNIEGGRFLEEVILPLTI